MLPGLSTLIALMRIRFFFPDPAQLRKIKSDPDPTPGPTLIQNAKRNIYILGR